VKAGRAGQKFNLPHFTQPRLRAERHKRPMMHSVAMLAMWQPGASLDFPRSPRYPAHSFLTGKVGSDAPGRGGVGGDARVRDPDRMPDPVRRPAGPVALRAKHRAGVGTTIRFNSTAAGSGSLRGIGPPRTTDRRR